MAYDKKVLAGTLAAGIIVTVLMFSSGGEEYYAKMFMPNATETLYIQVPFQVGNETYSFNITIYDAICRELTNCKHDITWWTDYPSFPMKKSYIKSVFTLPNINNTVRLKWYKNQSYQKPTYGNITLDYTCPTDNFNYTSPPAPISVWCWEDAVNGTTMLFHRDDITTWDLPTKTVWWQEWGQNGTETAYKTNLTALPSEFTLIGNKTYRTQLSFIKPPVLGTDSWKWEIIINIPPAFQQYFNASQIIIDPWVLFTADFKRELYNGTTGLPLLINGSGSYSASDLDNDATDEWCYWATEGNDDFIYYNKSSLDIGGVANVSEIYWYCTNDTANLDLGSSNSATTPDELRLDMPFDNYGAVAYDFAVGLNATLSDSPTQGATGQINTGYDFELDNTEYLTITDSTQWLAFESGSQDFSVCVWSKLEDYTAGSGYIIDYRDGSNDGWIFFWWGTNDIYQLQIDGKDTLCAATSDNNFHHVCISIDRSGNGQCYIDGTTSGNPTAIGGEVMNIVRTSVNIGTTFAASANWFDGILDGLQIFNKSLSASEIQSIYNNSAYLGAEEAAPNVLAIEFDWTDANSTINVDYTEVCVNESNAVSMDNCTLNFNGTRVENTTAGSQICFDRTSLGEGNYSTVNATCEKSGYTADGNGASWMEVDILPTPTWNWADKNSSLAVTTTTPAVTTTVTANCTLNFNGSYTANGTSGTSHSWYKSGLGEGNYSTINVRCQDAQGNDAVSTNQWVSIDTTDPVITVISDQNTTVNSATQQPSVTIDENVNCSLYWNGTTYANTTIGAAITWTRSGLCSNCNYTTIYVRCDDRAGNDAQTTSWWLEVDTTDPVITWDLKPSNGTVISADALLWRVDGNEELIACNLEKDSTTNYTMLENTSTEYHYWWTPVSGNDSFQVECNDTANNTGVTNLQWLNYIVTTIKIIDNDYGFSEPVYYPASWTSSYVIPLGQKDRNWTNQVASTMDVDNSTMNTSAQNASAAIDGSLSTFWSGYEGDNTTVANATDWWYLDLGAIETNIDYLKLYHVAYADNASYFFNISYSSDAVTWTDPTWGWGLQGNDGGYLTVDPDELFDARYFNLTYENQETSSTPVYLSTWLGGLAAFEVYNGGMGIWNVSAGEGVTLTMKINETNTNVTFYACLNEYDYSQAECLLLTTSYQSMGAVTADTLTYIWMWASFSGQVYSTYDWEYSWEAA